MKQKDSTAWEADEMWVAILCIGQAGAFFDQSAIKVMYIVTINIKSRYIYEFKRKGCNMHGFERKNVTIVRHECLINNLSSVRLGWQGELYCGNNKKHHSSEDSDQTQRKN